MPLTPVENLVRALEHPVYLEKLDKPVRQAWEFYFEDRGAYLEHHFTRVLLAEAWLWADAYHKHGGKRETIATFLSRLAEDDNFVSKAELPAFWEEWK